MGLDDKEGDSLNWVMRLIVDSKIPYAKDAFGTLGEVLLLDAKQIVRSSVRDADVLVVRSETRVGEELLKGSRVRFVGTTTIGTDHVDVAYLARQEISFASAPGSNANSVAEYVVAALLFLAERLGFALKGSTLGVVGVGNIGSIVVRYATALGMRVLQNDPPLARKTGNPLYRPLDEIMDADVVTLHVPLTREGQDATFHFFDEPRIARLKRDCILINTSRGGVVETSALKEALARRKVTAAVLDVWEYEPAIDIDLLKLTTLATPHIAGYSIDGKVNGTCMIYESLCRHLGVQPLWSPDLREKHSTISGEKTLEHCSALERAAREIVRRCYDIERDDRELRRVLSLRTEERSECFRRLRREYPERWEFKHATVTLPPEEKSLGGLLVALGFSIQYGSLGSAT